MTNLNMTLAIHTAFDFDMDELLYTNKLATAISPNEVRFIPDDFWAAATYVDQNGEVLSVFFFDENFTNCRTMIPALHYDHTVNTDHSAEFMAQLREHKDAGSEYFAMTFCVDEGMADAPSDFVMQTVIHYPSNPSALCHEAMLKMNDIQQMPVDTLPQLVGPNVIKLDRNVDLFVDTTYKTGEAMRIILDGENPVVDYHMNHSVVTDNNLSDENMVMVVTILSAAVEDMRPLAMR